ncbi:hypothetical protein ACFQY7_18460 [Actinomadura luteofluorescens]|uniref:hypothetical protein n=1 Tax=Actinomadura luteofluorescens TaxID=46163 RepID=UPI00362A6DEE
MIARTMPRANITRSETYSARVCQPGTRMVNTTGSAAAQEAPRMIAIRRPKVKYALNGMSTNRTRETPELSSALTAI